MTAVGTMWLIAMSPNTRLSICTFLVYFSSSTSMRQLISLSLKMFSPINTERACSSLNFMIASGTLLILLNPRRAASCFHSSEYPSPSKRMSFEATMVSFNTLYNASS